MALQHAHDVEKRQRTRDVLGEPFGEVATFSELMLSAPLLAGLSAAGFSRPSPIQLKAIPLARCGLDLLVQAKSGTGKTCVFATVALDAIVLENPAVQVLVLAPTREIAVQIHGVVAALGCKMDGLHCHLFIGGTPVSEDQRRLNQCHIAIGSPGRVKQLMDLGFLLAAAVRLFVLDEADKLLEEGSFQDQINWIYSSLPANKQMLALSATYPESMAQQLNNYMREPAHIRLDPTDMQLIGVHQFYHVVNVHALPHLTLAEKVQRLQELLSCIPFNQALIFSNLHSRAQHLANTLAAQGFPAACISGNMTQSQRLEAMERLKHFKCRVLISTDLMSRGIDADKVNLVVNMEVPKDWETYLHRVGRAGRFGTYGLAVTFCSQGEEESQLKSISTRCGLLLRALPDPLSVEVMADVLSTQEVDDVLPSSGAARAIEKTQPSKQSPSATHRINDAAGLCVPCLVPHDHLIQLCRQQGLTCFVLGITRYNMQEFEVEYLCDFYRQRKGIVYDLCVFRTDNGRGWGVRTLHRISKNSFVMEYIGEIITSDEAELRGDLYDCLGTTYLFDLDFFKDEYTVDATYYGNISHFVNHSCEPNLQVYNVFINNHDLGLPRIAFFTTRDVRVGEELTFDYNMKVADHLSTPPNGNVCSPGRQRLRIPCKCGSENCRKWLV
uniref:probable ATP-dependent RNA helicase DDX20 isoform X3 n=1 Tax=Myxine glutinosa TaxID=7769 RepID=UPI00358DF966